MYRPQIKVLDCTIRDGGLINNHDFDFELVKNVYRRLSEANIDYIEIGYKNSKKLFNPKEFGPWKFCEEKVLTELTDGIESNSKLSAMVDIGRVHKDEILPCSESKLDMLRVATYVKDVDKAIDLVNHCIEKGYETCVNIMAVSKALEHDLVEALKQLEAESSVPTVYIVDSFGSMYSEQIHYLAKIFKDNLKSKEIGIHAHNNQQLAFANTVEAIIKDANFVDGTVYGIGRAAGNCPLELILGFLKNPKFDIRPVLQLISESFIPLREQIEWGYIIPYMITGILNEHPRQAMAFRKTDDKDDYRKFFSMMMEDPD